MALVKCHIKGIIHYYIIVSPSCHLFLSKAGWLNIASEGRPQFLVQSLEAGITPRSVTWKPLSKVIVDQRSPLLVSLSSVQFSRSVVSDSLRPYEPQHSRPPCPPPTPGVIFIFWMLISVIVLVISMDWAILWTEWFSPGHSLRGESRELHFLFPFCLNEI